MKPFGPFALVASSTQDENLDLSPIVDMLVVKNASPFILTVQPYQGSQVKIPPYWADLVPVEDFQGKLTLTTDMGLASSNAPISVALVDAYQRGEKVLGTYPVPLSYLFNLGNNVPLSATATAVQNDGNAPGTVFVEATPSGGGGSKVAIDNSGNASFLGVLLVGQSLEWSNGDGILNSNRGAACLVYTPQFNPAGTPYGHVFQVWTGAAIVNPFSIGGQFAGAVSFVDGAGNVVVANLELETGANIFPVQSGGARNWTIYGWDGTSLQPAIMVNSNGSIAGHVGGSWSGLSIFSGTGSGTFSHGLGATPRVVLPMQHAVGSQTMGYDSENGTTVHITAGAGNAWVALAIA